MTLQALNVDLTPGVTTNIIPRDGGFGSTPAGKDPLTDPTGFGNGTFKNAPTTVPQTPLPNVTYAVGGVTIMAAGNAIGAIGVSGAPGGQFDDDCARAAIAKIQDRMK